MAKKYESPIGIKGISKSRIPRLQNSLSGTLSKTTTLTSRPDNTDGKVGRRAFANHHQGTGKNFNYGEREFTQ